MPCLPGQALSVSPHFAGTQATVVSIGVSLRFNPKSGNSTALPFVRLFHGQPCRYLWDDQFFVGRVNNFSNVLTTPESAIIARGVVQTLSNPHPCWRDAGVERNSPPQRAMCARQLRQLLVEGGETGSGAQVRCRSQPRIVELPAQDLIH